MSLSEKNNLDLSRYVALGDSVTSGYADGALFHAGQQNAYSCLISQQFQTITKSTFKQAFLNPDSVGIGFFGNSRMALKQANDCSGTQALIPQYIAEHGDLAAFKVNHYSVDGPFNNIAVPGAKTISLITPGYGNPNNGSGNYNPFFTRMASNPLTASVLSDALTINPSFFSLFIGNNDVLAFALSGGTIDEVTPVSGPPGIGFKSSIITLVNALTANGAKGVIANIPDITSIPHFTTIPYNGLLLDRTQADALNEQYKHIDVQFHEGLNPFVLEDHSNSLGIRLATEKDMILTEIMLDEDKCNYFKAIKPIPKKYTLNAEEVSTIQNAISAYNVCINSVTQHKGLAFVDVNSFVKTVTGDSVFSPKTCVISYKKRSVFSLDGIHLSPFGQAVLANTFIKSINSTYNSSIPYLSITKYAGIKF